MILIQSSEKLSREALTLINYCHRSNKQYSIIKHPIVDYLDQYDFICGNIEFINECLNKTIIPEYYPDFIRRFIKRNIFESNDLKFNHFIKPTSVYKKFNGFIYNEQQNKNYDNKYWCSEIVTPKSEWRLYVSNGQVLYFCDYSPKNQQHEDVKNDFFKLKLTTYICEIISYIPKNWSGTIDIMDTEEFGFDICECHHPYSIGWYGENKDSEIYYDFLKYGWKYLLKLVD